jgi:hypothetical protein
MTSSEKFSLKWNDFHEKISSAFNKLRDDTNFTDVTLVSEDGQQLQAHKVILSASSPFFMNILKLNRHPNPLIYLKGFKGKELHSIVDFMYYGVTEVYQENLDSFLSVAEELQLKGLTRREEENEKPQHEEVIKLAGKSPTTLNTQLANHPPDNEFEAELYHGQEYKPNTTTALVTANSPAAQVSFNGGTAEDLKAVVWSLISQTGTVVTCTVCGKTKDKSVDRDTNSHMASHVERLHVDGVIYNCPSCDTTFRCKSALHNHTYKIHRRPVNKR